MRRNDSIGRTRFVSAAVFALVLLAVSVAGAAGPQGQLASVKIPVAFTANGQPMAAGTYSIRLSDTAVSPVVGQSPGGEQWVEFLKGGTVAGKEIATVVTGPDAKKVLKSASPASGSAKVQTLKERNYVRVWITEAGKTYLLHLPISGGGAKGN
jgi:hypothetical protein